MVTRTRTQHTYRFTHEGREYARTTHRVYTHAVVCYRVFGGGGEPCHEQVCAVHFASSDTRASRAMDGGSYSRGVVIALEQPADVQAALRDILSQRAGKHACIARSVHAAMPRPGRRSGAPYHTRGLHLRRA